MQTPPPNPPNKEGPFLPRLKDGGILARFGDVSTSMTNLSRLPSLWPYVSLLVLVS